MEGKLWIVSRLLCGWFRVYFGLDQGWFRVILAWIRVESGVWVFGRNSENESMVQ